MNRIFVTGDTHGGEEYGYRKFSSKSFKEQKTLDKEDFIIIAGDFGMLWKGVPDKHEHYHRRWLSEKPWTTLAIDGNHENHERISQLPQEKMFGGMVRRYSDSIIFLKRGQVYTIAGKKIFAFGGARSTDRGRRKDRITWWSEEEPSHKEYQEALANLAKHNNEVDYIITHECPYSDVANLFYEEYQLNQFFDMIKTDVKFKQWHYGHHHLDEQMSEKTRCVYQDIIELK